MKATPMKASKTYGLITPPKKISSSKRTNISISFVGSGRVATHLALAFQSAGCSVAEVWSYHADHAAALAARVGAKTVDTLENLSADVDYCIVAISDDAIPEVAPRLHLPHSVVVHTSGATDAEVLRNVSPHYGVLWAPISFSTNQTLDYAALPFCVEGSDDVAVDAIERLAQQVSPHVYRLSARQRRHAHLMAVMANNFGNALLAEVQRLSSQWDIPFELLQPIILQTAQCVGQGDLWQRQTGPAARCDEGTMQRHRALLEQEPALLELYDLFSRLIAEKRATA